MRMKKSATIIQMMMDPLLPDPLLQNLRMRRILTLTNVDKEDWKGAIVKLEKKRSYSPNAYEIQPDYSEYRRKQQEKKD